MCYWPSGLLWKNKKGKIVKSKRDGVPFPSREFKEKSFKVGLRLPNGVKKPHKDLRSWKLWVSSIRVSTLDVRGMLYRLQGEIISPYNHLIGFIYKTRGDTHGNWKKCARWRNITSKRRSTTRRAFLMTNIRQLLNYFGTCPANLTMAGQPGEILPRSSVGFFRTRASTIYTWTFMRLIVKKEPEYSASVGRVFYQTIYQCWKCPNECIARSISLWSNKSLNCHDAFPLALRPMIRLLGLFEFYDKRCYITVKASGHALDPSKLSPFYGFGNRESGITLGLPQKELFFSIRW